MWIETFQRSVLPLSSDKYTTLQTEQYQHLHCCSLFDCCSNGTVVAYVKEWKICYCSLYIIEGCCLLFYVLCCFYLMWWRLMFYLSWWLFITRSWCLCVRKEMEACDHLQFFMVVFLHRDYYFYAAVFPTLFSPSMF